MAEINLSFRIEGDQADQLRAAFVALMTTRACRTCDYGDSPGCEHEQRALEVCTDPVGDTGCGNLACPGACTTPTARGCDACGHLAEEHGDEGCYARLRMSHSSRPCPCLLTHWQVSGDTAPQPTGGES